MWQTPMQRSKAQALMARREKLRKNRRMIHLKRVHAELKVQGRLEEPSSLTTVRLILNDFSPTSVSIFCKDRLFPGQQVSLTLEDPKRFYVKGVVAWCEEPDGDSRVMTEQPYSFRVGIQFMFDGEEESEAVKKFCESISSEFLYCSKKAA